MVSIWTPRVIAFAVGSFMPVIGLLFFIFFGQTKSGKIASISMFGIAALVLAYAALYETFDLGSNPTY